MLGWGIITCTDGIREDTSWLEKYHFTVRSACALLPAVRKRMSNWYYLNCDY